MCRTRRNKEKPPSLFFFCDFLFQGVGTSEQVTSSMILVSEAEAELQREVEELKLRLHMAAEHYKEKYRECQRLRRQVAKLNTTETQTVSNWLVKPSNCGIQ